MLQPNRPSSGVQICVVKESATHCKVVLFLLCGYLLFALSVICDVCYSFILGIYVITVLFGLLDVAVLNVLAGAGVYCVIMTKNICRLCLQLHGLYVGSNV
jgi:hypothetical protein